MAEVSVFQSAGWEAGEKEQDGSGALLRFGIAVFGIAVDAALSPRCRAAQVRRHILALGSLLYHVPPQSAEEENPNAIASSPVDLAAHGRRATSASSISVSSLKG